MGSREDDGADGFVSIEVAESGVEVGEEGCVEGVEGFGPVERY